VFAGDRKHRQRIFALVGNSERQAIHVKLATPSDSTVIQSGLLGRLGRVFESPATHPVSVVAEVGTLGTGQYIYSDSEEREKREVYRASPSGDRSITTRVCMRLDDCMTE
jgi:hypothetical protein